MSQGRQSPSPEALDLLCTALDIPLRFFLRPASSEAGRLGWLKDIGHYVARYIELPPVLLPRLPLAPGAPRERVEWAAVETRRALGVGCAPIADLPALLEKAGSIVSLGAGDQYTPISQWDNGTPWILARPNLYGLARETGFLVTGTQADSFARAFLLPAKTFAADVWAPTLDALLTLRKDWNCPVETMIRRCGELSIFDADQMKRAAVKLSRRNAHLPENGEPRVGLERPSLLARSIRLLIESGVKDRHGMLHDLALSPQDVEDLAGLPRGYLSEAPVGPAPELKLREEPQNLAGSIRQTL